MAYSSRIEQTEGVESSQVPPSPAIQTLTLPFLSAVLLMFESMVSVQDSY